MRKYFVTGFLVLIPVVITGWVLHLIIRVMDYSLLLLPKNWRPEGIIGFHIPGSGALLTILVMFVTGLLVRNYIGTYLHEKWEAGVKRIPLINSLYFGIKQVSETIFSSSSNAFRKAVLVQYPREGTWVIAFITGKPGGDAANHLPGDYISIYVPTTPNRTSG